MRACTSRWQELLLTADEVEEIAGLTAVGVGEDVLAGLESTTDWWMCMAEPGLPAIGLAMKVAYMSWRTAASKGWCA